MSSLSNPRASAGLRSRRRCSDGRPGNAAFARAPLTARQGGPETRPLTLLPVPGRRQPTNASGGAVVAPPFDAERCGPFYSDCDAAPLLPNGVSGLRCDPRRVELPRNAPDSAPRRRSSGRGTVIRARHPREVVRRRESVFKLCATAASLRRTSEATPLKQAQAPFSARSPTAPDPGRSGRARVGERGSRRTGPPSLRPAAVFRCR